MYSILHLETSNLYKKLLSDICAELGIDYSHSSTSEEAFQVIAEKPVSLIMTAMELKEGTSEQFIQDINSHEDKSIPIVVITGNDSFEDRKRMYDLGIIDYISKKSTPDEIKEHIHAYMEHAKSEFSFSDYRIAVCDDSRIDRKIIERVFRMRNVTNVDFYESAADMLSSGRDYDIYLIDLVLKNQSGHHVIKHLRERGCESVIIAISGVDNVKTVSRVLSLGADDYITKPYSTDLLMARIKTNARSYALLREVREKTKQLEILAVTDGLTQLYNHKFIFQQLEKEIEKNRRYKTPLSLLMLDLDFFKRMNDTYGHPFGDLILKTVSSIIKKSIRNIDYAGRYGGEEFMVILPQSNVDDAYLVAERIRRKVAKVRADKPDFSLTVSGGVSRYQGEPVIEFVKSVDNLLYKAKESGRNNIQKG